MGVFNAPLMNDAILEFKRYEDASLTYTGIDKHADGEVGGWDATIHKEQYEISCRRKEVCFPRCFPNGILGNRIGFS